MAIQTKQIKGGKLKVIAVILIVVIAAAIAGLVIVLRDSNSISIGKDETTVTIQKDWGAAKTAEYLHNEGIIKYPLVFRIQSRLGGYDSQYQPGTVKIHNGMSYKEILEALTTANRDTIKVVIPEGYEAQKIAEALSEAGLPCAKDFMDALDPSLYDYKFLKDLPDRQIKLEGYLFPATYEIPETATAEEVVDLMLKAFDTTFTEEYYARAEELGMSVDEIVTMASIVERETGDAVERAKVAGVFYNRLNSGMKFQSCATVQYVLGERKPILSIADTKIDSPYNTYVYSGLPIGPICNPGAECIKAALWPEDTDAFYFCLGKDGQTIFSTNYEDHIKAMESNDLVMNVDTSAVENEDSKK